MKKLHGLLGLCTLFICFSCSDDFKERIQGNEHINKIKIEGEDFKSSEKSRTALDIDFEVLNGSFRWVENDTLGIFPVDASNEQIGYQVAFPLENIDESKPNLATFTGGGWSLKSSARYLSYYPFAYNNRDIDAIPVVYSGQVQVGNDNMNHFGPYDYMFASGLAPENGQVNFRYKHLGHLIVFETTLSEDVDLKELQVIASDNIFTSKGSFDLSNAPDTNTDESVSCNIVSASSSNTLILKLKDAEKDFMHVSANTLIRLYVFTSPFNLQNESLTFKLLGTDKWYQWVESHTYDFVAGKFSVLTKDKDYVITGDMVNGEEGDAKLIKIVETDGRYDTLADAVTAAESGQTICLLDNIELDASVTVPAGKTLTLDLNGKTLAYTNNVAGEMMINNKGTLTVKDSQNAEGKISYTYTGQPDTSYGKGNYTIWNAGQLIVESGIVENATAAMSHASYAINTDAGAVLTVKGGKVLNLNAHAIRMSSFANGANTVTISGGYIEGTRAIQLQLPGSDANSAPAMSLTINGGELKSNESTYNLAVYVYSNGQSGANVNVNVNGGTINGNIALNAAVTTNMQPKAVKVTAGTINADYGVFSYADNSVAIDKIFITGGIFKTNYSEMYAVDDCVEFVPNTDGTFIATPFTPVAEVSGIKYSTLAKAIENADNATVTILSDITLEEGLTIESGKTITLDLSGKTISQTKNCTTSYSMITNKGHLTVTGNGTINFTDTSAGGGSSWGSYIIENKGTLVVENGTLGHLGSTGDWGSNRPTNIPIQNYAGEVIINGGVISSPMFRSLRDYTAGGEIVINGGTFQGQVWMQGLGNGSSSLTITGGEFSPTAGYDGSSVYLTNGTNDIILSVTGGTFNTKIGCADATKTGVKGAITGGTFTTTAKENTNAALLKSGYEFQDNGNETWVVRQKSQLEGGTINNSFK